MIRQSIVAVSPNYGGLAIEVKSRPRVWGSTVAPDAQRFTTMPFALSNESLM